MSRLTKERIEEMAKYPRWIGDQGQHSIEEVGSMAQELKYLRLEHKIACDIAEERLVEMIALRSELDLMTSISTQWREQAQRRGKEMAVGGIHRLWKWLRIR